MISRKVAMPALLAASVAGPYVASNAPQWKGASPPAESSANALHPAPRPMGVEGAMAGMVELPLQYAASPAQNAASAAPKGPGATLFPIATPLEGTPAYSIAEVFRFDVSKEWVYQRWARKSTALAELESYGVRVPLVTGTQLHDVAGSLTYFFGPDGRVRRIAFKGRTGDTSQIVALATQRYRLQAQATVVAGEQLFQRRDEEQQLISELWTRPASVLWSSSPHDSFAVELLLQDPATAQPLKASLASRTAGDSPARPAVTPGAAGAAAPQTAAGDSPEAAEEAPSAAVSPTSGWDAWLPRRRVPKSQIRNLEQGNLYQ